MNNIAQEMNLLKNNDVHKCAEIYAQKNSLHFDENKSIRIYIMTLSNELFLNVSKNIDYKIVENPSKNEKKDYIIDVFLQTSDVLSPFKDVVNKLYDALKFDLLTSCIFFEALDYYWKSILNHIYYQYDFMEINKIKYLSVYMLKTWCISDEEIFSSNLDKYLDMALEPTDKIIKEIIFGKFF